MEGKIHIIGEISTYGNLACWKISNFFSLSPDEYLLIYSPKFCIAKRSWLLFARLAKEIHLIGVYQAFSSEITLKNISDFNVKLGIIGKSHQYFKSGTLSCQGRGTFHITSPSNLQNLKEQWVPEGDLQFFFSIEDARVDAIPETFPLSNTEIGAKKLLQDLELLLTGINSDLIVKVRGKEFKAHRCIIALRSPVFLAMITHDTKENATGIIEIEDADPDAFSEFLHYLYTGRLDNATLENILDLYTLSDKYQVDELKNTCKEYMLENIHVENFCDLIALSLLYNEKKLTEKCIEFFKEEWNSLEIIKTSKWQSFMSENSIACNELFIKLLEFKKCCNS